MMMATTQMKTTFNVSGLDNGRFLIVDKLRSHLDGSCLVKCDICGVNFDSATIMNEHREKEHEDYDDDDSTNMDEHVNDIFSRYEDVTNVSNLGASKTLTPLRIASWILSVMCPIVIYIFLFLNLLKFILRTVEGLRGSLG